MARTVTNTEVAPPLPATSVDFNALHEACIAGKPPEDALRAALGEADAESSSDQSESK